MKISTWRAISVAAVIAGFLLNCGEFLLNRVVLRDEWSSGTHAKINGATVTLLAISMFAFAGVLIELHALLRQVILRPRHSAIVAGLICWVLAYGIGWSWGYLLGAANGKIYFATMLWSLIEVSIAALVGAGVYDKFDPPAATISR
jgi:hypothetical protein